MTQLILQCKIIQNIIFEPYYVKTCLKPCNTNNKGADQPAQLRNMISTFVVSCLDEPSCKKTGLLGFRLGPTHARLYPLKMARGLKFWISEVEGLYYLSSENKGADQLRSYCFGICKKPVVS